MSKRTDAFSLIELLTVIAIIAILAAILIPIVGKVQSQAKLSNCISNLRQWGMANLLYAQEHDSLIPWDGGTNASPNNMQIHADTRPWFNALPSYLDSPPVRELQARGNLPQFGDSSIFLCPSAERSNNAPAWLCYGPNYLLSSRTDSGGTRPSITRVNQVSSPSRLVLFAETTHHAPGSTNSGLFTNANPRHLGNATRNNLRHDQRSPLVFFDGHVEVFSTKELLAQGQGDFDPTSEHPIRWNPLHQ